MGRRCPGREPAAASGLHTAATANGVRVDPSPQQATTLPHLLAALSHQIHQPDEVIVVDDHLSGDSENWSGALHH
jgi:hypothetical protein